MRSLVFPLGGGEMDYKGYGYKDDDEYPVKMNFGCFLPIVVFAVIGIGAVFSKLF